MFRTVVATLAVTLLTPGVCSAYQATGTEAMLAMGIAQTKDGDFEAAVFALDTVVRRWEGQKDRQGDLARAYLHLGAAYVGLEYESAARGKFRKALKHDPNLNILAEELPPRVIEVFDSERLKLTAGKSKRARKAALIAGGAAAAIALGVGVVSGATANVPPTFEIVEEIGADGLAIAGVTQFTFTAMATDDDRDPLEYAWTFGDGDSATGRTVTHVFPRPGDYRVQVTVSDGHGHRVTKVRFVNPGTLSGSWRNGDDRFTCFQAATAFRCEIQGETRGEIVSWDLVLGSPRRVVTGELILRDRRSLRCIGGEVNSGLNGVVCFVEDPAWASPTLQRQR